MNAPRHAVLFSLIRISVGLLASISVLACERAGVEEHRVEKEGAAPSLPNKDSEKTQAAPAPQDSLTAPAPEASRSDNWPWRAPAAWRHVPGERPMRLATYEMQGPSGPIEVAISRFPGDVGGMLANVNRWRGQVGLPPTTESELADMIEPFENDRFSGSLLHIEGAEQHIVVASIFETNANQTWTVRVSAAPAVASAMKGEVFAFARTFGAAE
ncbi:MAG: hypothetical protein KF912_15200 [Phycisphaeraceae bacterium]|nr:hypothetical protein [Phycisphaeraceae bacterium]MBX3368654.1 hypothetical protein [Phycisphaeraceae bacterium]